MKKKIIIYSTIALLITSGFYYKTKEPSLIPIELAKIAPMIGDSAYFESMAALGFKDEKISHIISYVKNRGYWEREFGLKFIGNDEMDKFLNDNSFILGPASNFKSTVPVEAGKRIIKEYERISNFSSSYTLTLLHDNLSYTLSKNDLVIVPQSGQTLNWMNYVSGTAWASMTRLVKPEAMGKHNIRASDFFTLAKTPNSDVLIIASKSEFKTEGMDLINRILSHPVPKDPIAVIKVKDGYVELASWE